MACSIWVLMALLAGCDSGSGSGDAKAHAMVERGALLLDVRSPAEYKSGHIPGAVNIPVQQLKGRMGELPSKDRAIVTYCHSGPRSAVAAHTLRRAGYAQVHDMGRLSRW